MPSAPTPSRQHSFRTLLVKIRTKIFSSPSSTPPHALLSELTSLVMSAYSECDSCDISEDKMGIDLEYLKILGEGGGDMIGDAAFLTRMAKLGGGNGGTAATATATTKATTTAGATTTTTATTNTTTATTGKSSGGRGEEEESAACKAKEDASDEGNDKAYKLSTRSLSGDDVKSRHADEDDDENDKDDGRSSPTKRIETEAERQANRDHSDQQERGQEQQLGISRSPMSDDSLNPSSLVDDASPAENFPSHVTFLHAGSRWSVYNSEQGYEYYLRERDNHSQWEDPRVNGVVEYQREEGYADGEELLHAANTYAYDARHTADQKQQQQKRRRRRQPLVNAAPAALEAANSGSDFNNPNDNSHDKTHNNVPPPKQPKGKPRRKERDQFSFHGTKKNAATSMSPSQNFHDKHDGSRCSSVDAPPSPPPPDKKNGRIKSRRQPAVASAASHSFYTANRIYAKKAMVREPLVYPPPQPLPLPAFPPTAAEIAAKEGVIAANRRLLEYKKKQKLKEMSDRQNSSSHSTQENIKKVTDLQEIIRLRNGGYSNVYNRRVIGGGKRMTFAKVTYGAKKVAPPSGADRAVEEAQIRAAERIREVKQREFCKRREKIQEDKERKAKEEEERAERIKDFVERQGERQKRELREYKSRQEREKLLQNKIWEEEEFGGGESAVISAMDRVWRNQGDKFRPRQDRKNAYSSSAGDIGCSGGRQLSQYLTPSSSSEDDPTCTAAAAAPSILDILPVMAEACWDEEKNIEGSNSINEERPQIANCTETGGMKNIPPTGIETIRRACQVIDQQQSNIKAIQERVKARQKSATSCNVNNFENSGGAATNAAGKHLMDENSVAMGDYSGVSPAVIITVKSASNLPQLLGRTTPYFTVSCGGVKKKSKVASSGVNPVFDESFIFDNVSDAASFDLKVYSKQVFVSDDFLGQASIPSHPHNLPDQTYTLKSEKGESTMAKVLINIRKKGLFWA